MRKFGCCRHCRSSVTCPVVSKISGVKEALALIGPKITKSNFWVEVSDSISEGGHHEAMESQTINSDKESGSTVDDRTSISGVDSIVAVQLRPLRSLAVLLERGEKDKNEDSWGREKLYSYRSYRMSPQHFVRPKALRNSMQRDSGHVIPLSAEILTTLVSILNETRKGSGDEFQSLLTAEGSHIQQSSIRKVRAWMKDTDALSIRLSTQEPTTASSEQSQARA